MNEKGRKTNTNYVDSDAESEQNLTPNHVFSVGDRLGQRSGIVTVVVGAVHLPNALSESGATCNLFESGLNCRKSSVRPERRLKPYFRTEIQNHCQDTGHLEQTLCSLTLVRPVKLILYL